MPPKQTFRGIKLEVHVINDKEVRLGLEWDQDEGTEDIPNCLVNLLDYIRGEEALRSIIKIFKRGCKSTKRPDLFRDFNIQLKTMAMEQIAENDEPMISPMEVLGKKRLR